MPTEKNNRKAKHWLPVPDAILGLPSGVILALFINLISGFEPDPLYWWSLVTAMSGVFALFYYTRAKSRTDRKAWAVIQTEQENSQQPVSFLRWIEIQVNLYSGARRWMRLAWFSMLLLFAASTVLIIVARYESNTASEKRYEEILEKLDKLPVVRDTTEIQTGRH